ncbi:glycogen synthase [Sarotherodon galilaeus]
MAVAQAVEQVPNRHALELCASAPVRLAATVFLQVTTRQLQPTVPKPRQTEFDFVFHEVHHFKKLNLDHLRPQRPRHQHDRGRANTRSKALISPGLQTAHPTHRHPEAVGPFGLTFDYSPPRAQPRQCVFSPFLPALFLSLFLFLITPNKSQLFFPERRSLSALCSCLDSFPNHS